MQDRLCFCVGLLGKEESANGCDTLTCFGGARAYLNTLTRKNQLFPAPNQQQKKEGSNYVTFTLTTNSKTIQTTFKLL